MIRVIFAAALMSLGVALWLAVPPGQVTGQAGASITVGDNWFCDPSFAGGVCETTVTAGEPVLFYFGTANNDHTSTECGGDCASPTSSPLWDTGVMNDQTNPEGFPFVVDAVDQPGTYLYYCQVHGAAQMQGRIVVQQAGQAPTATEPSSPTSAAPTSTEEVTGLAETSAASRGESSAAWWPLLSLAAAGAAFVALGALTLGNAR